MNKTKITSIMIVSLLVGLGTLAICGAEELDGNIVLNIEQWQGNVHPNLSFENQSVTFKVNISEKNNNTVYRVEDELKISLNVTDNSGREIILLPRGIFYRIVATRSILDVIKEGLGFLSNPYPGADKFLKRWRPISSINFVRIKSTVFNPKAADNITLELDYSISNETYLSGENLTMSIAVMGYRPGDINGLSDEGIGRIIDQVKINLEVFYEEL